MRNFCESSNIFGYEDVKTGSSRESIFEYACFFVSESQKLRVILDSLQLRVVDQHFSKS